MQWVIELSKRDSFYKSRSTIKPKYSHFIADFTLFEELPYPRKYLRSKIKINKYGRRRLMGLPITKKWNRDRLNIHT